MPIATATMLLGGFALAAMPLTAGFVSKSAIMQALADEHAAIAWFGLTAISAGSFLYAGLKLPWFAMLKPGAGRRSGAVPPSMTAAMALLALLILAFGVAPDLLVRIAPGIAGVPVLTADHVLFQLQLLTGAGICFVLLLALLVPRTGITIDTVWLWREFPYLAARIVAAAARGAVSAFRPAVMDALPRTHSLSRTWVARLADAANWRTGDIALAATALLGVALLIAAL